MRLYLESNACIKKIASGVVAIIGALGILLALLQYNKISASSIYEFDSLVSIGLYTSISLCLITIAVFVCLFIVIRRIKWNDIRGCVVALIFAVLLSFSFVVGCQLDYDSNLHGGFSLLIRIVLLTCALFPLTLAVLQVLASRNNSIDAGCSNCYASKERQRKIRLCTVLCIFGLLAIWVFWYLVLFPGVYGYDGGYWYLEYAQEDVAIDAQWSIPYTWLYYQLIEIGNALFGSYNYGFALFSAVQMSFIFFVAARVLAFLAKRFNSFLPQIATAFYYAFVPLFPILAVSSAQDACFMALFGLLMIHLISMTDDPSKYWQRDGIKNIPRLFIVLLLFCLVRNNGYIIIIALMLFAFLYSKGFRLRLLLVLFAAIAVTSVFHGPILSALGVSKTSTIREMMSVPSQQIARVYSLYSDSLSDEETSDITSFYLESGLNNYSYNPCISDSIKSTLDTEKLQNDPLSFLSLYFKLGKEYPVAYTEAALLNTLGAWYPNIHYPDSRMYHPYIESECLDAKAWNERYIQIDSLSVFPKFDEIIHNQFGKYNEHFSEIPILGTICKAGTYFFILLFLLCYMIYIKNLRYIFILVSPISLVITVLLGPVILCRYMMPLLFITPLLLSLFYKRFDTIDFPKGGKCLFNETLK